MAKGFKKNPSATIIITKGHKTDQDAMLLMRRLHLSNVTFYLAVLRSAKAEAKEKQQET